MNDIQTHLDNLEAEAIEIMREVVSERDRLSKDSEVIIWLKLTSEPFATSKPKYIYM